MATWSDEYGMDLYPQNKGEEWGSNGTLPPSVQRQILRNQAKTITAVLATPELQKRVRNLPRRNSGKMLFQPLRSGKKTPQEMVTAFTEKEVGKTRQILSEVYPEILKRYTSRIQSPIGGRRTRRRRRTHRRRKHTSRRR